MTATDLAGAYARVSDLYRRQIDLLAADEPDLDEVAALGAALDAELVRMPTSDRLPPLGREDAERLHEAVLAADALRASAAARLEALRAALVREAAQDERAAGAARAYQQATPATARFLDQTR